MVKHTYREDRKALMEHYRSEQCQPCNDWLRSRQDDAEFEVLQQVATIREAANEIADLALEHQTPQMRECLAGYEDANWRRIVLAVRYANDDIRLAKALGFR